jgi:hypothetical protein
MGRPDPEKTPGDSEATPALDHRDGLGTSENQVRFLFFLNLHRSDLI